MMISSKFCLKGYLPAFHSEWIFLSLLALFLRCLEIITYIFHWEKNMIYFELGPTEIWTRIAGFKVQSANHYTIGPLI